jgi:hypothetical protein
MVNPKVEVSGGWGSCSEQLRPRNRCAALRGARAQRSRTASLSSGTSGAHHRLRRDEALDAAPMAHRGRSKIEAATPRQQMSAQLGAWGRFDCSRRGSIGKAYTIVTPLTHRPA